MSAAIDRAALAALSTGLRAVHRVLRTAAHALARGEHARCGGSPSDAFFDSLERLAGDSGLAELHRPRLDEMRLELDCAFASDEARRRAHAFRWGNADVEVLDSSGQPHSMRARALSLATTAATAPLDERTVDSAAAVVDACARAAGLSIRIVVDPALVADAASGEHTLFLAARAFAVHEVRRLAAHELLGHLTAAANAETQPLALLRIGTAGSWEDQEGVALALERRAGVLGDARARRLGARALAALVFLEGGTRHDAAHALAELGLPPALVESSVARAFRSGGSARDLAYLRGIGRVESFLRAAPDEAAALDRLRIGRTSVAALGALEALVPVGLVRPPVHRPSLALSLAPTFSGTSLETSPPSRAASFTRFDAT